MGEKRKGKRISFERVSAYKTMWLFVMFDLPTETARDRKQASRFRKNLIKHGFSMMQFSVYHRYCGSQQSTKTQIRRIKSFAPPSGNVSILSITDKQFENIIMLWGKEPKPPPTPPPQLELF